MSRAYALPQPERIAAPPAKASARLAAVIGAPPAASPNALPIADRGAAPAASRADAPAPARAAGLLKLAIECASASIRQHARELRHRRLVARHEARIAKSPDDLAALADFAAFNELSGARAEAAACYARLATAHCRRRAVDEALMFARKADRMGSPDAARLYRAVAAACGEAKRYDEGARACLRVAEIYLAEGQTSAIAGFANQLPPLGPRGPETRSAIEALLGRPVAAVADDEGDDADVLPLEELALERRARARGAEPAVFLAGSLGPVSPFDVVQIVENNRISGRFEVECDEHSAVLHFDEGRIVAARVGALAGHDAAKFLLTLRAGAFRVVLSDDVPADEFRAASNTGFLVEVLREIEEQRPEGSTEPLVQPSNGRATTDAAATLPRVRSGFRPTGNLNEFVLDDDPAVE